MAKKKAWKVEPDLIDRFLNVLVDFSMSNTFVVIVGILIFIAIVTNLIKLIIIYI